jgi:hypothetical protein
VSLKFGEAPEAAPARLDCPLTNDRDPTHNIALRN